MKILIIAIIFLLSTGCSQKIDESAFVNSQFERDMRREIHLTKQDIDLLNRLW